MSKHNPLQSRDADITHLDEEFQTLALESRHFSEYSKNTIENMESNQEIPVIGELLQPGQYTSSIEANQWLTHTQPNEEYPPEHIPVEANLPCSICNRKFMAQDRLDKHMKVCAKSQKPRKVFNMTKARVSGTEMEKYVMAPPKKEDDRKVIENNILVLKLFHLFKGADIDTSHFESKE
jgi:hypothetical protein